MWREKKKGRFFSFFLNGCLMCSQLTCQCSHFQIGAISGFSGVLNESGPPPIEDSVHIPALCNHHMLGVSILRIKIAGRFFPVTGWKIEMVMQLSMGR